MGGFQSFEELACWKEARVFRNFVKDSVISDFPSFERFGLTSQIRRSSRSVGNNIAEGFGSFIFKRIFNFAEWPEDL